MPEEASADIKEEAQRSQIYMNHKARRTGAMILAMAILSANTAYASQVLTATAPGNAAQTVSTGTTYQQSGEGYVNSGPGTVGVFAQNGTSTTPGTGSTQGNTQNGTQETQGNTQNGVTLIDPSGNPTTVQPGMGQTTVPQTGTAADPSGSLSNAGTTGTAGSNTSVSQQTQIKAPEISSEAGVLYDATTGQFLFDKEGSKPMYPASITKLMTALLAVENLSLEAIMRADPDYIFVTPQGSDKEAAIANIEETFTSSPAWQTLRAVKEGRYYVLDPYLYNLKQNERWGEAYEKMADILYPESSER